jgi:hypothetical protein
LVYFLLRLSFVGDGFKRGDHRVWNYLLVSPILGEIPKSLKVGGGGGVVCTPWSHCIFFFTPSFATCLQALGETFGEWKLVFKFQITIGTSTTMGWFILAWWMKGIGGGNFVTLSPLVIPPTPPDFSLPMGTTSAKWCLHLGYFQFVGRLRSAPLFHIQLQTLENKLGPIDCYLQLKMKDQ